MQDQTQPVYPGQYQSQHLAHYATQQPPQQSLENPIRRSFEDLEECPNEDPDEDPIEYSDGDTDEYMEEDMDEGSDAGSEQGAEGYQVDDQIVQSFEDPDPDLYRVCDAQQAHSGYQTAATAPVTRAFGSLGLTSLDAQPGPSQPRATSQVAGAWARNHGLPALPDPIPNPFGSAEQHAIGYEISAPETESTFGPGEEWEVRTALAYGGHIEEIAERVETPTGLVQHFVLSNNLVWTPQQDFELRAMVDQGYTMSAILQRLRTLPGGPARFDYEVNARAWWLMRGDWSAQEAGLAGNPQSHPRQSSVDCQPGEALPPQANQEAAAETQPARGEAWDPDEIKKLREWRAQHGRGWDNVENALPGRTRDACRRKWFSVIADDVPQEMLESDLTFLRDEAAKGIPIWETVAKSYPSRRVKDVTSALQSAGWSKWTTEEDEQVVQLQKAEGDDWAQISNKPGGTPRSTQEVKYRYELLTEVQRIIDKRRIRAAPHQWTERDNKKLGRKLGRGMTCNEVAKRGFHGMQQSSIRKHAILIGVNWTDKDDDKLRDMNLKPDANFDWDAVGRRYNPERKGDAVKARWKFIQGLEASEDESSEDEAMGDEI